nr:MAG TPA: telomeric repeat-binding factor 2-interacting protein [Caudoviricetes sp.]
MPSSNGIKKEDLLIVEDEESTKKCTVQQLDTTLGISALKQEFDSLGLSIDEEGYIVQEVEE